MSRPVCDRLQDGTVHGRVVGVFERACAVQLADGEVFALVLPAIGNGPLNVVVECRRPAFQVVSPGTPARCTADACAGGSLRIDLTHAWVWEPRPDWILLRNGGPETAKRLALLHERAFSLAPASSLLALRACTAALLPPLRAVDNRRTAWHAVSAGVRDGIAVLAMGWAGDLESLRAGAARLAGLGGGLTPAGDDFLLGMMLKAWLAHADPEWLCRHVVEVAAPLTTTLSAAFLRAAARGECGAAWHALLSALVGGGHDDLTQAMQGVLSYGATSGADALAGFLWAGSL